MKKLSFYLYLYIGLFFTYTPLCLILIGIMQYKDDPLDTKYLIYLLIGLSCYLVGAIVFGVIYVRIDIQVSETREIIKEVQKERKL